MLTFGVTVLPDPPHTRFLELMQLAEEQGFDNGWTYDSHILWHDAYPLLTLLADTPRDVPFLVNGTWGALQVHPDLGGTLPRDDGGRADSPLPTDG